MKTAGWRIENNGTVVELETDADSGFHDFRDGTHVVIDVLAPKTDADAYKPPGMAKPPVTSSHAAAGKQTLPVVAQVKAIAAAAKAERARTAPEAGHGAAAAAQPQAAANARRTDAGHRHACRDRRRTPATGTTPRQSPAAPTTCRPPTAKLIRNGAVLTFPGAGRRGSAVFMRGMTAWIVLQNAAPLGCGQAEDRNSATFPPPSMRRRATTSRCCASRSSSRNRSPRRPKARC